jgi:hypothetical protein
MSDRCHNQAEGLEKLVEDTVVDFSKEDAEVKEYIPPHISNLDLYREIMKSRKQVIDLQDNITTKRIEIINMYKAIMERCGDIFKHMRKWFIGAMIIAYIGGSVSGAYINQNWTNIKPYLSTILDISKIAKNSKSLTE